MATLPGEAVGDHGVDADARAVEGVLDPPFEPSREDGGVVAGVVQGFEQVGRAGSQAHPVEGVVGPFRVQSLQQRSPFAQALGVSDLVVHRAFRDLGHPVGDATLFAKEHRHLRVGERAVEVEGDESHTDPLPAEGLNPPPRDTGRRVPAVRTRIGVWSPVPRAFGNA